MAGFIAARVVAVGDKPRPTREILSTESQTLNSSRAPTTETQNKGPTYPRHCEVDSVNRSNLTRAFLRICFTSFPTEIATLRIRLARNACS